jgi:hypothetical protein
MYFKQSNKTKCADNEEEGRVTKITFTFNTFTV